MSIDQQINDRVRAFSGNPAKLAQRYSYSKDLLDLLTLQKLQSDKNAVAKQMQAAAAGNIPTDTIKGQREKEIQQRTQQEVAQQMGMSVPRPPMGGMPNPAMGGRPPMGGMPPAGIAGARPPMQGAPQGIAGAQGQRPNPMGGVAGLPTRPMGMASGGIVNFKVGGDVDEEQKITPYRADDPLSEIIANSGDPLSQDDEYYFAPSLRDEQDGDALLERMGDLEPAIVAELMAILTPDDEQTGVLKDELLTSPTEDELLSGRDKIAERKEEDSETSDQDAILKALQYMTAGGPEGSDNVFKDIASAGSSALDFLGDIDLEDVGARMMVMNGVERETSSEEGETKQVSQESADTTTGPAVEKDLPKEDQELLDLMGTDFGRDVVRGTPFDSLDAISGQDTTLDPKTAAKEGIATSATTPAPKTGIAKFLEGLRSDEFKTFARGAVNSNNRNFGRIMTAGSAALQDKDKYDSAVARENRKLDLEESAQIIKQRDATAALDIQMKQLALDAQKGRIEREKAFAEAREFAQQTLMMNEDYAEQSPEMQQELVRAALEQSSPYWAAYYEENDALSGQGIAQVTVK